MGFGGAARSYSGLPNTPPDAAVRGYEADLGWPTLGIAWVTWWAGQAQGGCPWVGRP